MEEISFSKDLIGIQFITRRQHVSICHNWVLLTLLFFMMSSEEISMCKEETTSI